MVYLDGMVVSYFDIYFLPCVCLTAIAFFLLHNKLMERRVKWYFYALIIACLVEVFGYCFEIWARTWTKPSILRTAIDALGYAIRPLILYLVTLIALRSSSNKYIKRLLAVPTIICAVAGISTFFCKLVYWYDENNRVVRGPLFYTGYVMIILSVLSLVIVSATIAVHRENKYEVSFLAIIVVLILAGIYAEFMDRGVMVRCGSVTLSTLLYYFFFQTELYKDSILEEHMKVEKQNAKLARQEAELAEKRNQIMVSQIQPHFIFNVLGSIEQLCNVNPKKAGKALHSFARYLRTNLDSLGRTGLVQFKAELQHVRTYMALEELRFEEDLHYVEDIETDAFSLPALSVQPLIENAVKHGMMSKAEGILTVRLSTRAVVDGSLIRIEDDGGGFDLRETPEDNRAHIGLSNVKERIRAMTGGDLMIESVKGIGTTITIWLPKGVTNENSCG